jgi:hypothetical protein
MSGTSPGMSRRYSGMSVDMPGDVLDIPEWQSGHTRVGPCTHSGGFWTYSVGSRTYTGMSADIPDGVLDIHGYVWDVPEYVPRLPTNYKILTNL